MKKSEKVKQVLDTYRDGPRMYRVLLMGDNGIKTQCAESRDLDCEYNWQEVRGDDIRSDYIRTMLGIPRRYVGDKRP